MTDPDSVYFAYGSNLNLADLDDWSQRCGHPPGFLEFVSVAWLNGFCPCFTLFSKTRAGGVLDIRECVGDRLPGVLFRVREPSGWVALDRKERAPTGYHRIKISVELPDGKLVPATTYRVCEDQRLEFVQPSPSYVKIVQDGLAHWGLRDEHIIKATQHRPA